MERSVYVALDFPDWKETDAFLHKNHLRGVPVKVGMELFYREGPHVIQRLKENGHAIFLDLKLHDIPTTVGHAMRNLAILGVDMVTVHALGGSEMIRAAKTAFIQNAQPDSKLIAVTILTSIDNQMLQTELHMPGNIREEAVRLAQVAKNSGADGVVCAVSEASAVKQACSNEFLTVTPGIRLDRLHVNDQKRVATPSEAIQNGADILVIGRSVTQASDPQKAYHQVLEEMAHENE